MPKKTKPPKRFPAQSAMFVTRDEALIAWTLLNLPQVAFQPAIGHISNSLFRKVQKVLEDTGGVPVPQPQPQQAPANAAQQA